MALQQELFQGKPYQLAPSVLSADFARLHEAIELIDQTGAQIVHLDIMDGHFVPNLTFGPPVIKALRPLTKTVFDAHLMVTNPKELIGDFANAGVDMLSVHAEVDPHIHRLLGSIKDLGMQAGIVYNPGTPVDGLKYILDVVDYVLLMSVNPGFGGQTFIESTLDKAKEIRDIAGAELPIQIDGGIHAGNIEEVKEAGINIFVAGSAFFSKGEHETLVDCVKKFNHN